MQAVFPQGLTPLKEADPVIYEIVEDEKIRQWSGIELIASENFTSKAVIETLGSCLTNKYSEGMPGKRYYGGNQNIDKIENLCRDRALETFSLNPEEWGVNVQPYSGSPANMAVYVALLNPHDRIMGLDLPSGGHLTHGFYNARGTKVSATSIFFESLPYTLSKETGTIDYDRLEEMAMAFRPKMIICGGSAYPREWDYARFRQIADKMGCLLMCDMAHISGLVATGEAKHPFEYCDIVTTTTHKSLRGPRAGMIFSRRGAYRGSNEKLAGTVYDYESKIDFAVFPSLQGGPHNHQIGALAVALKQAQDPAFKLYQKQVRANACALAVFLMGKGYKLVTDGTENHLILWDLRPQGISGNKMETVCDRCHITLNKNAVFGDASALTPGGVRIGAPAMTSRGLKCSDFEKIGEMLHRAMQICIDTQAKYGKKLVDFTPGLDAEDMAPIMAQLKADSEAFAKSYEMPGFDLPAGAQ